MGEKSKQRISRQQSPKPFIHFDFRIWSEAKDLQTFASWVHDWNDLSGIWGKHDQPSKSKLFGTFGSNLQSFLQEGADPEKPNGNSINQVRTNDFVLGRPWQMREFVLASKNTAHNAHLGKNGDKRRTYFNK